MKYPTVSPRRCGQEWKDRARVRISLCARQRWSRISRATINARVRRGTSMRLEEREETSPRRERDFNWSPSTEIESKCARAPHEPYACSLREIFCILQLISLRLRIRSRDPMPFITVRFYRRLICTAKSWRVCRSQSITQTAGTLLRTRCLLGLFVREDACSRRSARFRATD